MGSNFADVGTLFYLLSNKNRYDNQTACNT